MTISILEPSGSQHTNILAQLLVNPKREICGCRVLYIGFMSRVVTNTIYSWMQLVTDVFLIECHLSTQLHLTN